MSAPLPTIVKPSVAVEINRAHSLLDKVRCLGLDDAAKVTGVHRSSLFRLKKKADSGDVLFDRRRLNPGAASAVDETRLSWALSFMADKQRVSLTVVCRELNKVALREGWPETDYYALRRAVVKLPLDVRVILTEGGKAVYAKTALFGERVSINPLELVQIDCTEVPVWTIHPATGEMITPWMTGIVDTATRVITWVEFHLGAPDAVATAKALTSSVLPKGNATWPFFGLPEKVGADNAQIYKSELLNGVAVRAGFVIDHIPNACPGANGKIERFFETFETQFFAKLPGYSGQTSGKGKAESRGVIPFAVLQSLAQRALLEYHSSIHSGIGTTPWEKWHENIGKAPGYIVPPAEIRKKMRIEIEVDVTTEGVTVLGSKFSGVPLVGLVGDKVTVLTAAEGGAQSLDAYHKGRFIGCLRPRTFDIESINAARLDRKIKLCAFRKDMRESLTKCAPCDEPATVLPKDERARISAKSRKKSGSETIRIATLGVEPAGDDNEPST